MASHRTVAFLVALASCVQCANTERCTNAQQLGVIIALAARLRAGCVVLGVDDLAASGALGMLKALSTRGTMTSLVLVTRIREIAHASWRCRSNRPLIVLLPGGHAAQALRKMAKLPSIPLWLLFLDDGQDGATILQHVHVPFDCELLLADSSPPTAEGVSSHVTLTEVYRVAAESALIAAHFATWREDRPALNRTETHRGPAVAGEDRRSEGQGPARGLEGPTKDIYERRTNLRGLRVRAATLNSIMVTIQHGVDGKPSLGGSMGKLWAILEAKMNFTTEVIVAPTSAYGLRDANGSWNGMVGMVMRGEADLALGDFALNAERAEAVSFFMPLMQFRSHIFIRKPEGNADSGILSAFSPGLWLAIGCCTLLAASCLTALRTGHYARSSWAMQVCRLADAIFHATAMLCLQGDSMPAPSETSARLALAVIGLTGVVLAAALSAVLTAVLSVQRTLMPFASIAEFAEDSRYQLGIPRGSQQVYFNQNTSSRLVRRMYDQLITPHINSMPLDSAAGARRVCAEEHYAWLESDVYLPKESTLRAGGCELVPVPEAFLTQSVSSFVAKNWPIRGLIDHNLRVLRDSGVVAHLLQMPEVPTTSEPSVQQVELVHVAAVGALVALGLAASCAALAAELAFRPAVARQTRHRARPPFKTTRILPRK